MYLTLPKESLNRLKKETLAGLGKEGKGAAIVCHLDWIAVTAIKILSHILANRARAPGGLRNAANGCLITVNTPMPTTLLGNENGDD